jgi:hypothetical protein
VGDAHEVQDERVQSQSGELEPESGESKFAGVAAVVVLALFRVLSPCAVSQRRVEGEASSALPSLFRHSRHVSFELHHDCRRVRVTVTSM